MRTGPHRVPGVLPDDAETVVGPSEGEWLSQLAGKRQLFLGVGKGSLLVVKKAHHVSQYVKCHTPHISGNIRAGGESHFEPAPRLTEVRPRKPKDVEDRRQAKHPPRITGLLEPGERGAQIPELGIEAGQPSRLIPTESFEVRLC